jgi:ribosomal protein S18 acetylase RimI-like enzyme
MSEHQPAKITLGDFREEHGSTVIGWVTSAEDALGWAELPYLRVRPDILAEWHAAPGVVPCVGWIGEDLCAYGQILEDHVQREAEVARIIVAPELRGRGIGPAFVSLLAAEATRRGFDSLYARTVRANRAAFACYRAAGFERVSREDEVALNLDQTDDYVWLELARL